MPLESRAAAELRQPVLASKLNPPRLRNVLTRTRLIKLASLEKKRLLTICAGPGYGKTTLMAQLSELHDGPKVWYQVDNFDRDPAVFLRHLITGISNACNGVGKRSLVRLSEATNIETEGESILAVLIDEMGEGLEGPLMLCIDDYSLIDSTDYAHRIISYLIQHFPDESLILLTSRTFPNLSLARIKSHGFIQEIIEEDLRFSIIELSELLDDIWDIKISETDIGKLNDWLEGWASGLVLTESYLRVGGDMTTLLSKRRIQQNIFEYLAEEVFDVQSEDIKALLLYSALMDTIDPELCAIVFNTCEVSSQFIYIEKNNLFTVEIGGTGKYRQHPLFRKYLLQRLSKILSKTEIADARVNLAKELESRGKYIEAIQQYFLAESKNSVIKLIEKLGSELVRNGEHLTLKFWIDSIGKNSLTPILQVHLGQCLMALGEPERALSILQNAKSFLGKKDTKILCDCVFAISECFTSIGKSANGINDLEPLMSLALNPTERAETLFKLCICHWNSFNSQGFREHLSQVSELAIEGGSDNLTCRVEDLFGLEALQNGDFPKARNHFQNVTKIIEESYGQRDLLFAKNNLACSLLLVGKYSDALEEAAFCLTAARSQRELCFLPLFLDTYGCVLLAQGKYDGDSYINEAVEMLKGDSIFENGRLFCHLGTWERRKSKYLKAIEEHKKCIDHAHVNNNKYDYAMGLANLGADYIRSGIFYDGEEILYLAYNTAIEHGLNYVLTNIDFHRAWAAHLSGDNQDEKKYLYSALKRARKYQHNHFMIQEGKISLPLFTTALSNDIESDYVSMILEMIGEPVLFALEPLLSSQSVELRNKITRLIGRIGGRNAVTLLHRSLKDEEAKVRGSAKAILANLRHEKKLPSDILTSREMEVLGVLATGASNRQIAELLFISEPTVKTHVNKIFRKLGINRRLEAVLYFQQMKKND